ncbi:ketoacyl-ACP synthase III [Thermoflavimicrobium daqui]|uniref:Beta-ketoacyl-[acyl-carrier-protein] synthase III n=1 Tax=Thermoflavimicrobium daqui TaxID=2137476 RepID=A0A364K6C6_9BACL|nr:ketoacyl-ACP synthase III [Thermoflavimicrobium daqui]RAL25856.1 ketoacyl-ACP synthase III [Thermoflavimicrobium daqui]
MIPSLARMTAIGTYVPKSTLTNYDFEKMIETSDAWIVQRTGIRERRVAAKDEYTSDLCIAAIKNLLERYPVSIEDVDFIIVSTTTPDFPFPSVACQIQKAFGIQSTGAIDISAACAGFVYGLQLANALITSGMNRKILVLGSEVLSKVTDYSDRSTCILFGDGAGVALVEKCEEESSFLYATSGTDGKGGIHLYRTGLSSQIDTTTLSGNTKIVQNGREVFKFAVNTLTREVPKIIHQAGFSLEQLDWFVPHSANQRIIDAVCDRINFPKEKTLFSGEYFGNTSSASIPLALQLGMDAGKLKKGDLILLSGFGGGLTHAHLLMKWTV